MTDEYDIAGGMSERAVRVFLVVDTSTSMAGNRIGTLNLAVRETIPVLRDAEDENSRGTIEVRALEFSSGTRWLTDRAINVQQYSWTDLVASGVTDMGAAFLELADALSEESMPSNAFPPVIILVSDGGPTDDYQTGLQRLNRQRWAKAAIRCAISVEGANLNVLREFLGHDEFPLLEAKNVEDLKAYIKWATVALSKVSSMPVSQSSADGEDVTTQLPPPPPPTDSTSLPDGDVW